MTEEKLKKEFENRKLKNQNKQLLSRNSILNKQLKDLQENFLLKVNKEVSSKLKVREEINSKDIKVIEVKVKNNTNGLYKDWIYVKFLDTKIFSNSKFKPLLS